MFSNKLKILHIIPNLRKGGAERLVLDICNNLNTQKDCKVTLITFRVDNSYSFLTNDLDWEVIPSSVQLSISGKSMIDVQQLQDYIDTFQPDVIHSHLFETEMVLAHISLPTKTKRIVHFHDNMHQFRNLSFNTFFNKNYLADFFEKRIVLKSYPENTTALCISKDTKKFADQVLPRTISKKLLQNAIDLVRFQPNETQPKSNEITIIGSLVNKKGQHLAIDCIAELKSRGILVHLNVLGEGPNKALLQDQITHLNLQDSIILHGNVQFPEHFLQKCSIYLHTAIYEPFGLVLIEAMACGLPVVCTDGKGNRDLIQEGENGFMVWERDPEILADKIELLLKNDAMRIEMGKKANVFAQDFGMKKYVNSLINLYKSV
jgi:glycosyltransferase involved in cell wall biosynthesis